MSKISDVLASAGAAVLNVFAPGAGTAVVAVANAFLDDDKKLNPETATGDQVKQALAHLPPEQAAVVMGHQVDLQVQLSKERVEKSDNFTEVQTSIHDLEKLGKSKSRSIIALMMAVCLVMIIAGYMYGRIFASMAPFSELEILALLSVPAVFIKVHMGIDVDMQTQALAAKQGQPVTSIPSLTKAVAQRMSPR